MGHILRIRPVEHQPIAVARLYVNGVADHAYDFKSRTAQHSAGDRPIARHRSEVDSLSHRIRNAEKPPRHGFVDDDYRWRLRAIPKVEVAPGEQAHPECLEVPGPDQ